MPTPTRRPAARSAAPTRRPAVPAQSRRNAAATPTRRPAAEPEQELDDEATPFDASTAPADEDTDEEGDEEELPAIVDLSDVEASTFDVVPRGTYEGWIDSVEYGLSQSSNLPMLTWILKFMYDDGSEDKDGNPKGERERTVRWYTTLFGDGAGRTKASLAKLDPELDLAKLVPEDMDAHFGGLEVKIRVTIRPDRDDHKIKRNNVADVLPLEEGDF